MSNQVRHAYSIFAVCLILINVWLLAAVVSYPDVMDAHMEYIALFEYFVLVVFSTEYLSQLITAKRKLRYLFGYDGLIDLISILPALIDLFFFFGVNTSWVRVLRLVRIMRILKALKYKSWLEGVAGKVLPYIIFVFGFEGITLVAEAKGYWSTPKDLNISLGVVGFSVAVMLGAKLSVVSSRIYSIEDAICRLVGSMRDMWQNKGIRDDLSSWSHYLEKYITAARVDKSAMASIMRDKTDALEVIMEENSVGGPNSAGFHRDAAFIIHRATASIPEAYDKFLKTVICLYMLVIIISVSGVSGLLASLLSVFILGGLYYLVDDMDDPLSFQEGSFIDARTDALSYWNETHSTSASD